MISTLLILYDTIQQSVANTPTLWDKISTSPIFIILSILGALASIFGVYSICKSALNGTRIWREQYIKDNILDDELNKHNPQNKPSKTTKSEDDSIQTDSSYDDNIDSNIYIQPYILTPVIEVPDDNATPTFRLKKPFLLRDFFIKKVFVRVRGSNIPKYYYLFGNSGTGKTAALVHLFYDYINQYNKNSLPYNIRIFSLREENVFESIDKVNVDKMGCILLLDALDENPMVQKPKESEEYKLFIKQLDKVYSEFAFVITTCRPQFFSEEKEIPDSHNIAKIELVPFNDDQINEFLDKIFNISNEAEKRSKAINLIDNHHEIAKRPIILTYIRDLVDTDRKLNTSLDFYDTIAESELRRNISRIPQNVNAEQIRQWWNMTSEVAGFMYKHGKTEISYEELRDFLIQHGIDHPDKYINEDHFQRRSLLTRTDNAFHFSHKSFYEYFMAYRFLQYPEEIKQVYGMDFALQIYNDALQAWSEQKDSLFAVLKNTHPYTVAFSLNRVGNALKNINHFNQAELYYQHALKLFRLLEKEKNDTYKDDIAMVLNNLAGTYWKTNHLDNAIKILNETLTTYRQLADKNPDAYLPDVAMTLNNLGLLHRNTNQLDKAKEEYNEALTTYRQLAAQNPDAYLSYVAATLNNLATLHSDTNQLDKAEEEYNEALTTYRQLADKNPDAYLPYVATTLNNLAALHYSTNQYEVAEEEYNEALTIRRQLADKNPDAYLPNVAETLNNLAALHYSINKYKKAEEEYNEALTIRRQLADKNPDAFLPKVANTLNNLAVLHKDTNQLDKAEEEYNEALAIRRQLADKNPDAFLPDVAMTLNNLAILHKNTNQYKEAEEKCNEALTICRQLADKNPDAYLQHVADTLENLANLHSDTDRLQDAEEEYKDVLSIRQKLADNNPDAYLHKVAQTFLNMALLHLARKEYSAAEAAAQESLEKYRIMAEKSHAAFDPYVKKAEVLLEVIRKAKEADA